MIKVNYNKVSSCPITSKSIEKAYGVLSKEYDVDGEMELNIVSDSAIKKLNFSYRGKNKVTDVLSFAWQEDKKIKTDFLGQMYISYDQIKRQSKEFKVTIKQEFYRMLAHGFLHIIGYDHGNEKEAKKMFSLQEKVLEKIINNV